MKKIILLTLLALAFIPLDAQQRKTKNLVIVTLDGSRWKELFRGADSVFLFGKTFNSQDSA
jgi:hypothetical protein